MLQSQARKTEHEDKESWEMFECQQQWGAKRNRYESVFKVLGVYLSRVGGGGVPKRCNKSKSDSSVWGMMKVTWRYLKLWRRLWENMWNVVVCKEWRRVGEAELVIKTECESCCEEERERERQSFRKTINAILIIHWAYASSCLSGAGWDLLFPYLRKLYLTGEGESSGLDLLWW